MLRPNETSTYGADIDARLLAIQKAISREMEYRLLRTFGAVAVDATQLVFAGPYEVLILPVPARAITSVTTGGTVAGGVVTGGALEPAANYEWYPYEPSTGLIYGLRRHGGLPWGIASPAGVPLTPVVIVADFADTDEDALVPDDITYAANLLILRTFQREQTGIAGVSGPDGTFSPPMDPWKDAFVKTVLDRYSLKRVPVF